MEKLDPSDPYGRRPARRTQWIVSTLAHHYGLDRGVENEIVVLATGLDQYLQEIFHHMDYRARGRVHAEDFGILCEILGLHRGTKDPQEVEEEEDSEYQDSEEEEEEDQDDSEEDLTFELTFRQFHAQLCGHFSARAGRRYEEGRLLVGKDSRHIETQIRLRSPLRRRGGTTTTTSTTDPDQDQDQDQGREGRGGQGRGQGRGRGRRHHVSGCRLGGSCCCSSCSCCCSSSSCTRECYEEIVALEEAEDRIAKVEEENGSLRELIEDMRAALQSSDARCLALQVSSSWWRLSEGGGGAATAASGRWWWWRLGEGGGGAATAASGRW